MKCENCEKEHDGSYATGRFCKKECARSFSSKNDKGNTKVAICIKCGKETQIKKRSSFKKAICEDCKVKKCKICGILISYKNTSNCCKKHYAESIEFKIKMSESVAKAFKDGKIAGWTTRNIKSYPEEFFIKVLENNKLNNYIFNYPIKKSLLGVNCHSHYFLDFYFPELNLDLEIDGRQHEKKERANSDKVRDELLKEHGIVVYRIKWKSINKQEGKDYIKSEINKFLDFYKSLMDRQIGKVNGI